MKIAKRISLLLTIIILLCNVTCNTYAESTKTLLTSITLSDTSISLDIGTTYTLSVSYLPTDATVKGVTWTSSNIAVATVSSGTITAVAEGTSTITATATDGSGLTASCLVTVDPEYIEVTSITLSDTTLELDIGETDVLDATVLPYNASDQEITWKSTDTDIATVDQDGYVKGISAGTCKIKAISSDDSSIKAVCKVTVVDKKAGKISKLVQSKQVLSKKKTSKNSITVTYSKGALANVTYEIQYKYGKKSWSKVYTNSTTKKIKNLVKLKTYKIRVRASKKIGEKVYYSKWSNVIKVKVK